MAERPILFSGEMVRALREGRKTQTRRTRGLEAINAEPDAWVLMGEETPGLFVFEHVESIHIAIRCPYGIGGDSLWTRECFSTKWLLDPTWEGIVYRADDLVFDADYRWRPSIHMPRWASRNTLEVVSTRPERLQSITKADAIAEGIQVLPLQSADDPSAWYQSAPGVHQARTAMQSFGMLVDSNRKTLPFKNNHWAWRIEFRV